MPWPPLPANAILTTVWPTAFNCPSKVFQRDHFHLKSITNLLIYQELLLANAWFPGSSRLTLKSRILCAGVLRAQMVNRFWLHSNLFLVVGIALPIYYLSHQSRRAYSKNCNASYWYCRSSHHNWYVFYKIWKQQVYTTDILTDFPYAVPCCCLANYGRCHSTSSVIFTTSKVLTCHWFSNNKLLCLTASNFQLRHPTNF